MNRNLRLLIIGTALTGIVAAYTATIYNRLPAQIPVHFNAAGIADRYQDKASGAWLMVYMMIGVAALFAALPLFSPKTKSIESFRSTYDSLAIGILVFFGIMQVIVLSPMEGHKLATTPFGLLMCALFGFLGNLMGKVTPNYYVGIRTPWTLESPENWERTHRFAARLTVGAAIIGAILTIAGIDPVVAILICVAALLVPVGYSYWLYTQTGKNTPVEG